MEETKVKDNVPRNVMLAQVIPKVSYFSPQQHWWKEQEGKQRSIRTIKIKTCLPYAPHQETVKQAEVL